MTKSSAMSRRECLRTTGVMAAGLIGINHFAASPTWAGENGFGYGPLQPNLLGLLELPRGFSYRAFSRTGEWMDDDLMVPGAHDGMATFPGPNGTTIIVRNHELTPDAVALGAHGGDRKLWRRLRQSLVYDQGHGKRPSMGGTTTLVYDTQNQKLIRHSISLAGTTRNCSGGPTPWGSWLTCEESVDLKGDVEKGNFVEQDHGYVFEVPATPLIQLADPVPLKDMGRFNHEAVAVDTRTSIVYLTEDRDDGLLFRFLPKVKGQLEKGGQLQALKLKGEGSVSTRNWPDEGWIYFGQPMDVEWVDMDNVESPKDDLRVQGTEDKKAAIFARGEGIWYDRGVIYIACTSGGPNKQGQVFKYVPSEHEGEPEESGQPGQLSLFCQPNSWKVLQMADNLTVAPWGDVIICEDGAGEDFLVGITPQGTQYRFARNTMNGSEFAGSTFSPDGTTLFVNIQSPGITLAITGPWDKLHQNDAS